jgi:hypothetical protein
MSNKVQKLLFALLSAIALTLLMMSWLRHASAHGGGASPNCTVPPIEIRVERISGNGPQPGQPGYIAYHDMENDYLGGVLIAEVGPEGGIPYWHDEALKAEAVAARTFATYRCQYRVLQDSTLGIYDDERDQVYYPEKPSADSYRARYDGVVTVTKGIYIVYRGSLDALDPPHDSTHIGLPIEALFGADNGITTTSAYQEPGSEYEYARSVHDPVSEGCLGNCWGFSQRGAHRWASQYGWSWQQILYHYYTNVEFQQKHTFTANYYNDGDTNPDNDFMPSKLVATQADVSVDYNWSGVPQDHSGSPIPGMPADYFSVRWTGQISVTNDSWYTFYLTSDDGARLYVDDKLIVDDWSPAHHDRTRSGAIWLASGGHSLQLDYYEATDTAVVRLSWLPGQGLVGAYYNDYEAGVGGVGGGISGTLVMTRPDVPLRYYWPLVGSVSLSPKLSADPARPMVPGDEFSVHWEGSVWADQPGIYTFTTRTDDGLRLWMDGQLVTDDWNNGPIREHEPKVLLSSGRHEVWLEYYEQIWSAYAELTWAWSGTPQELYLPIVMKSYY